MKEAAKFIAGPIAALLLTACGPSAAHRDEIANDQLILIRKGSTVAGIAFTQQSYGKPDVAEYNWIYRDDGGTLLDPSELAGQIGHGTTRHSRVYVGDIQMFWSYGTPSAGYIYYEHFAHQRPKPEALQISVTQLKWSDLPLDANSDHLQWRQKP